MVLFNKIRICKVFLPVFGIVGFFFKKLEFVWFLKMIGIVGFSSKKWNLYGFRENLGIVRF